MALITCIPPLEYPVTRQFQSKVLTRVAYALGFLSIIILCILNVPTDPVALVGYEPITVLRDDFYASQTFWFDKFVPSSAIRKSGKSCDGHVFNIGDVVLTSASLFEWKLEDLGNPDPGTGSFIYEGQALNDCDILRVTFYGDIRTWSMEANIFMSCSPDIPTLHSSVPPPNPTYSDDPTPQLLAVASFTLSGLMGIRKGTNFRRIGESPRHSVALNVIELLLWIGWFDISNQLSLISQVSNHTGVVAYSTGVNFYAFCPPSFVEDDASSCGRLSQAAPKYYWGPTTAVLGNNTLEPVFPFGEFHMHTYDLSSYQLEEGLNLSTSNFIHLIRAAVLLDIGSNVTNNFFTNPDMVDQTLRADFPPPWSSSSPPAPPTRSRLYDAWKSNSDENVYRKESLRAIPAPSMLQTVFLCHFYKLKSPGSLIVSVFVATLSMVSSAWSLALAIAAYLVKRKEPQANWCDGHGPLPHADTCPGPETDSGKQDEKHDGSSAAIHKKADGKSHSAQAYSTIVRGESLSPQEPSADLNV
ncbi:hypothetical protein NMY22_g4290 [Coprinellus aureogranulatus]|nr:hypothetical protein NMY22_g4290 [Coprinellus aureogranulatus]